MWGGMSASFWAHLHHKITTEELVPLQTTQPTRLAEQRERLVSAGNTSIDELASLLAPPLLALYPPPPSLSAADRCFWLNTVPKSHEI